MQLLGDILPKFIESLSVSIIYKLSQMMNGQDFTKSPDDSPLSDEMKEIQDNFYNSLLKDATPEDIEKLKKLNIPLENLSIIDGETL